MVAILPPEMNAVQRTHLVRNFARDLADRYRNAVDFAVHEPRKEGDARHHHAHLLLTAREVQQLAEGALPEAEKRAVPRELEPEKNDKSNQLGLDNDAGL
jgi:hypothetical protein